MLLFPAEAFCKGEVTALVAWLKDGFCTGVLGDGLALALALPADVSQGRCGGGLLRAAAWAATCS